MLDLDLEYWMNWEIINENKLLYNYFISRNHYRLIMTRSNVILKLFKNSISDYIVAEL